MLFLTALCVLFIRHYRFNFQWVVLLLYRWLFCFCRSVGPAERSSSLSLNISVIKSKMHEAVQLFHISKTIRHSPQKQSDHSAAVWQEIQKSPL